MGLFEQLKKALPELTDADFGAFGTIRLQDDSDGQGPYIAKWDYAKSIPDGLKLGK